MRVWLKLIAIVVVSGALFGCSDPAANKEKAKIGEAAPEATSNAAASETLPITPDNSKIDFVASKVTRSHNGSFKQFNGKVELQGGLAGNGRVSIDIEAASVITDEPDLTAHLKTADFFDVTKFPKATFTSTKIEAGSANDQYNVIGNFELHGMKQSISFPATIQVAPDAVSVNAEFSINRRDFGLVYPGKADDLIRDNVVIKLTIKTPRRK